MPSMKFPKGLTPARESGESDEDVGEGVRWQDEVRRLNKLRMDCKLRDGFVDMVGTIMALCEAM